jgi:hypothetical protein
VTMKAISKVRNFLNCIKNSKNSVDATGKSVL